MAATRILLADDHVIVRESIRVMLEANTGFEIVGEASTGREAVQLAKQLLPDVIVMDIAMPKLNGLQATRQILSSVSGVRVLILTAYREEEYVHRALEIGVSGILLKANTSVSLSSAIRRIMNGETVIEPVLEALCEKPGASTQDPAVRPGKRFSKLTSREVEVLQLVAEGSANKQIASELGVSIKTVEKHRQRLMDKLGIHDIAGLTHYAISKGLIPPRIEIALS